MLGATFGELLSIENPDEGDNDTHLRVFADIGYQLLSNPRAENIGVLEDALSEMSYVEDEMPANLSKVTKPYIIFALALAYRDRFERTRTSEDLDHAIENLMKLQDGGHHIRSSILQLGESLKERFKLSGRFSDLQNSIEFLQQVAASTPEDYSYHSLVLS